VERLLVLLAASAIFIIHARWIFAHFSNDPYLLDSGWFAYLFESRDPLLHNPSVINELSYYAHHLSPHIFLFGAPIRSLTGSSGVEIFAWHQGFCFSLCFVALYLMAARTDLRPRDRVAATLAAVLVGSLSNVLFQAAAYPHFEIAMFAMSSMALAAWVSGHRRLFVLSLAWLPLIREDGGLFASFICLVCMALEYGSGRLNHLRQLAILAVSGAIVSGAAFAIKAVFFPGFDAFTGNFAGRSWEHLSAGFLATRLRAMFGNANILPVLVGSAVLATRDVRYAAGVVLLSPLYLVHLISVRPEHGAFTLYYALPWLLAWVTCLGVFVERSKAFTSSGAEALAIIVLSVTMTAPLQSAVGVTGNSWYMPRSALERTVVDIGEMRDFALWVKRNFPTERTDRGTGRKYCATAGIAALIPDNLTPEELLGPRGNPSECRTLLMLRDEMDSDVITGRAAAHKFKVVEKRHNAELWFRDAN
jgi:hypothetical protein